MEKLYVYEWAISTFMNRVVTIGRSKIKQKSALLGMINNLCPVPAAAAEVRLSIRPDLTPHPHSLFPLQQSHKWHLMLCSKHFQAEMGNPGPESKKKQKTNCHDLALSTSVAEHNHGQMFTFCTWISLLCIQAIQTRRRTLRLKLLMMDLPKRFLFLGCRAARPLFSSYKSSCTVNTVLIKWKCA